MNKWIFLFGAFFLAVPAFAQTTVYDPNAQLRTVSSFKAIEVSGGIQLFISAGKEAIAVSAAEEKYCDRIRTEVTNGVLKIWYDEIGKFSMNGKKNLKAYVSFTNLEAIGASGGSHIVIAESIKLKNLSIKLSGGAELKGMLDVDDLFISQSGGSDMQISGKVSKLSIDASGGSDFDGYGLVTEIATIAASGASDIEITVNKELSAKASGASDILYKGTASIKESKSSGASTVSKRS